MLETVTFTNTLPAVNYSFSSNISSGFSNGDWNNSDWTIAPSTYPQTTGGITYPSDVTIYPSPPIQPIYPQTGTTVIWPPAVLTPEQMQEIVDEVIRRLKAEGAEEILPIIKEKIRDKKPARLLRPINEENEL